MIVDYDDCIETMKQTSYDSSLNEYVTECNDNVINFDKFVDKFFNYFNQTKNAPKVPPSVDVACKIDNEWFLIEFKNGYVDREQIFGKIAHSLLVLMRNENIDITEAIASINFILVFNKTTAFKKNKKDRKSLNKISNHMFHKASPELVFWSLKQFEGCYLKKVYTLDKECFDEFLVNRTVEICN